MEGIKGMTAYPHIMNIKGANLDTWLKSLPSGDTLEVLNIDPTGQPVAWHLYSKARNELYFIDMPPEPLGSVSINGMPLLKVFGHMDLEECFVYDRDMSVVKEVNITGKDITIAPKIGSYDTEIHVTDDGFPGEFPEWAPKDKPTRERIKQFINPEDLPDKKVDVEGAYESARVMRRKEREISEKDMDEMEQAGKLFAEAFKCHPTVKQAGEAITAALKPTPKTENTIQLSDRLRLKKVAGNHWRPEKMHHRSPGYTEWTFNTLDSPRNFYDAVAKRILSLESRANRWGKELEKALNKVKGQEEQDKTIKDLQDKIKEFTSRERLERAVKKQFEQAGEWKRPVFASEYCAVIKTLDLAKEMGMWKVSVSFYDDFPTVRAVYANGKQAKKDLMKLNWMDSNGMSTHHPIIPRRIQDVREGTKGQEYAHIYSFDVDKWVKATKEPSPQNLPPDNEQQPVDDMIDSLSEPGLDRKIGERIKQVMMDAQVTAVQLSGQLRIPLKELMEYITGTRPLGMVMAKKIAELLRTDISVLFKGMDKKHEWVFHGKATGRWSSSKANIQNFPREEHRTIQGKGFDYTIMDDSFGKRIIDNWILIGEQSRCLLVNGKQACGSYSQDGDSQTGICQYDGKCSHQGMWTVKERREHQDNKTKPLCMLGAQCPCSAVTHFHREVLCSYIEKCPHQGPTRRGCVAGASRAKKCSYFSQANNRCERRKGPWPTCGVPNVDIKYDEKADMGNVTVKEDPAKLECFLSSAKQVCGCWERTGLCGYDGKCNHQGVAIKEQGDSDRPLSVKESIARDKEVQDLFNSVTFEDKPPKKCSKTVVRPTCGLEPDQGRWCAAHLMNGECVQTGHCNHKQDNREALIDQSIEVENLLCEILDRHLGQKAPRMSREEHGHLVDRTVKEQDAAHDCPVGNVEKCEFKADNSICSASHIQREWCTQIRPQGTEQEYGKQLHTIAQARMMPDIRPEDELAKELSALGFRATGKTCKLCTHKEPHHYKDCEAYTWHDPAGPGPLDLTPVRTGDDTRPTPDTQEHQETARPQGYQDKPFRGHHPTMEEHGKDTSNRENKPNTDAYCGECRTLITYGTCPHGIVADTTR